MPRTRQAMKQRRPAATDDGMNDDAVLVDESQLLERSRELGRSDEDTPLGLRFQRRDRLAKITLAYDIAALEHVSGLMSTDHPDSFRNPRTSHSTHRGAPYHASRMNEPRRFGYRLRLVRNIAQGILAPNEISAGSRQAALARIGEHKADSILESFFAASQPPTLDDTLGCATPTIEATY